jgi:hypothetical protein
MFDFSVALFYIKVGIPVSLILNGKERQYRLNDNGDILCIPNGKKHLEYKVNSFHLDAIMSDQWRIIDETN